MSEGEHLCALPRGCLVGGALRGSCRVPRLAHVVQHVVPAGCHSNQNIVIDISLRVPSLLPRLACIPSPGLSSLLGFSSILESAIPCAATLPATPLQQLQHGRWHCFCPHFSRNTGFPVTQLPEVSFWRHKPDSRAFPSCHQGHIAQAAQLETRGPLGATWVQPQGEHKGNIGGTRWERCRKPCSRRSKQARAETHRCRRRVRQ